MALTPAQLATIRADILADATLNAKPNTGDGADAIATIYNAVASPAWTVWRTSVNVGEVGNAISQTELAGLTTGNNTRLQTTVILHPAGFNPSLIDTRNAFDDIFSGAGGTNTRAALASLWKRSARRVEKLFSTGTGSVASPATMTFEGMISYQDVEQARAG